MKKVMLMLSVLAVAIVASSFVLAPAKAVNGAKSKLTASTSIPADVYKVFEKSCIACHSDGGNGMAAGMVNFPKWDTYNAKKQAKKSAAVCKAITKGSMPPGSYKTSHPEAIPNAQDIKLVTDWATSLKIKK
ncbi:MAG: heme-binding domain-containing protein [Bacteroidota bacterium]